MLITKYEVSRQSGQIHCTLMAALEEAEYIDKSYPENAHHVAWLKKLSLILDCSGAYKKQVASLVFSCGGIILETCVPFEENHNIYD